MFFYFCSIQPMFYCKLIAEAVRHPCIATENILGYLAHEPIYKTPLLIFSGGASLPLCVCTCTECPLIKTIPSLICLTTFIGVTTNELRKVKTQTLGKQLCKSAKQGNLAAAQQLLNDGADPNYRKVNRYAPLHYAASKRHIDMLALLVDYGANINAQTNNGWTPLMHLVSASSLPGHEHPELVEQFLRMHPDIEMKNNSEDDALLQACHKKKSLVALPLLEAGANIHVKDQYGDTPLHIATYAGNKEIVRHLLARGADKTAKNKDGSTPLDYTNDDTKELFQLNNVFRQLKKRETGQQVKLN